ncbi:dopamine D2-like receptor [Styela clava]|uniref:dopamine D2-like receptor n=1 Tax=Styela clava TaxID=7725 RepID=UPI001939FE31|nr:dopamine D2-like receptor [Styela clava]
MLNFVIYTSIIANTLYNANAQDVQGETEQFYNSTAQQTTDAVTNSTQELNYTTRAPGIRILALCGFAVYSNESECSDLRYYMYDAKASLSNCEIRRGFISFCLVIILMSLAIILSNILLPVVVWKTRELRTQYNYIKVSLALADLLSGIVMLCTTIPNMLWMRYKTEREVVDYILDDRNSIKAIVSGSFIMISLQATILHLLFLSFERFIALRWPFWHQTRKTRSICLTLLLVWIISLSFVFIPGKYKFK